MKDYQSNLIQLSLEKSALRFGEFTLKSGRHSPYFFNAGLFNDGLSLGQLARAYAQRIVDQKLVFDMVFGPAYKGIPLATATAWALSELTGRAIPFAFNRKEAKTHGEGGQLIGAPIQGKVLIIDDVISAGVAIQEAINLIKAQGATLAGVIVALDRQEKGLNSPMSAVDTLRQEQAIPVMSIISLVDLIRYVEKEPRAQAHLPALRAYQKEYGVVNP